MANDTKKIKLGRYKLTPYTVRFVDESGMTRQYEWAGMRGEKVDIKPVPEGLVNFLEMNSFCFKQGELKIIEDTKIAKEIVENLTDKEEYEKMSTASNPYGDGFASKRIVEILEKKL